MVGGVT